MKHGNLLRKVSLVGVSALCCLTLVGCSGSNYGYTGGVAATVNGTEIEEDTITKYIQDFRINSELTSNDDWANWLTQNSLDPSTVRSQVIDYYVEIELKKQAASENGISVSDSDIQTELDKMKSNYADDAAWQEALSTAGLTEDQYRESIEQGLIDQKLMETVAPNSDQVDDGELLEMLNTYYTMFDGAKRSSHILFASDDETTAQTVLDQINSGEISFEDAAKQYSTDTASAENGGDVGWDAINTFVDSYTTALDGLSKGQVSGLVTSDYGIHIIKCTDEFSCDGTATSVDAYPQEFRDYISDILASQNQATAYNEWYENYKSQADIQINDMPNNVPYNLDMTQYESESTDGTAAGTDGATAGTDGTTDGSAEGTAEGSGNTEGGEASADGSADQAATTEESTDTSGEASTDEGASE